jgi:Ran GTPase-activating protein (RanGAP) involved in mRNA processing and transport
MGDFARKKLTDQDMDSVGKQIFNNNQYKLLGLGENKITSVGASILANALNNNNTLKELGQSHI